MVTVDVKLPVADDVRPLLLSPKTNNLRSVKWTVTVIFYVIKQKTKQHIYAQNVDEEEGCTLKLLQRSKQGLTAPGAAAAAAQRKPLRRRRHSSSSSSSSSSDEIERRVRSAGVVYTVTVPPAQVQHARAVNDSATQNILPDKVADTETPKHKRKRKHKKKKRKRGDTEAGTDVPGAALSDVKKKRERTTSSSNSADSD